MAFSQFYDSFSKKFSQYQNCKSIKDLIIQLTSEKYEKLNFNIDQKSDSKSKSLRENGNKLFRDKKDELESVCDIYTKSLFYAESDLEKAYSYGNRSSVLFKTGLYKPCLVDIEYAIKCGYPNKTIYKLLIRKAESYLMLEDFQNALGFFSHSLEEIDHNCDTNINSWRKRVMSGLQICQMRQIPVGFGTPVVNLTVNDCALKSSMVDYQPNEQIPSMSAVIRLKIDRESGRGIYADEDVMIGEILALEKPYAYRLSIDRFLTHCYCCLRFCPNLVPCDTCCTVGFCDDDCRRKGKLELRHDLECGMLTEILSTRSKELGLLSYGIICQTDPETIRQAIDIMDRQDHDVINEVINSQSYLSAVTIETNENQREFSDLFDRTISSLFLCHCFLKMLNDQGIGYDSNNLISIITEAFCKHLQGIPCNAHSLSETKIPMGGSLESSSVNYIGNALYPALSLINHSCSPNVIRITMRRGHCILKAISPIKSGEQIFDNYSLHFATSPLDLRQKKLKEQYYFDCHCLACKENWPTFDKMLQVPCVPRFMCNKCQNPIDVSLLVCSVCNLSIKEKYQKYLTLQSRLSDNMELLLQRKFQEAETYLVEFSILLYDILKPSHILFNQTSEMLKFIWSLKGSTVSYF